MKQQSATCFRALAWALILVAQFSSETARAQAQDPLVIVTGFFSGNVVALDRENGVWVEVVEMAPDTPPETGDRPRGIAIGPNHLIYVSLRGGDQNVKRYWWDGSFIDDFIPTFPGPMGPGQIEFTQGGDLIVGGDDHQNSSVLRYDGVTGELLDSFRVEGFTNLVGITLNEPFVYAGAPFQTTVLRFDLSQDPVVGVPLASCCTHPLGMTISHRSTLLATDYTGPLVQEFDATTGAFLGTFVDLSSYGVTRAMDIIYDPAQQRYYLAPGDFHNKIFELDHSGAVTRTFSTDILSGPYSITIATPPVSLAVPNSDVTLLAPPAVTVAPNPGRGPFTILSLDNGPAVARLYDSVGRLVRQITGEGGQRGLVWDGRDNEGQPSPAGVYYLRIGEDPEHRYAKVVLLP